MLKKILCLLLLTTPAFAGTAPVPNEENPFNQVPRECDIQMEFRTFSSGIDSKLYELVMKTIVATPAITEKHLTDLNKLGERVLCLRVKPEDETDVYIALLNMIPESSTLGWEKITRRSGESYKNAWPQKFTPKPVYN
jgi:hypothetical protein